MSGKLKVLAVAALLTVSLVILRESRDDMDALPGTGKSLGSLDDMTVSEVSESPTSDAVFAREALPVGTASPSMVCTGRLLDEETGVPIAGSELFLSRQATWVENGSWRGRLLAISGADGRFRLEDSKGLSDLLIVQSPDRALHVRHLSDPGARSVRGPDGSFVLLELGDLLVPPGTEVSGRVLSSEGIPVPGACLLLPRDMLQFNGSSGNLLHRVRVVGRSGADGRFVLDERLVPGEDPTYLVAATARGMGWAIVAPLRKRSSMSVDLQLRPSARVDVLVQDEAGSPFPGARVRMEPAWRPIAGSVPVELGRSPETLRLFERSADAEGRAGFTHLPLGEGVDGGAYLVVADVPGFRISRERLTVAAGTPSEIVVRLASASVITGRVTDGDDGPIAGARVALTSETEVLALRTGTDGSFRMEGVRTGLSSVYFSVAAEGFTSLDGWRSFDPEAETHYDFMLHPAVPLYGQVVDQDGTAVAGARVRLDREPDVRKVVARTDDQGRFRVEDLGPGEHHVSVVPPVPRSGWVGEARLSLRSEESPVQVVLERIVGQQARLFVEVVDQDSGRPLDPTSAQVFQVGPGPRYGFDPVTEYRIGGLVVDQLHPGRWKIRVQTAEGHRAEREFTIEPGQVDASLRLEIGALGIIEGRIDLSDIPVSHGPATLRLDVQSRGARWVNFGADGLAADRQRAVMRGSYEVDLTRTNRFRLEHVDPSAPVRVRVSSPFLLGSLEVTAAPGVETQAVLRPTLGGRLELRTEALLPPCRVTLRTEDGEATVQRLAEGADLSWTLRPGRIAWDLEWSSSEGPQARRGTAIVRPGSTTAVHVGRD